MRRNIFLFSFPAATILTGWAFYMAHGNLWLLFSDNWFMTATMVFGSFIAGASSEGGGAIAFPAMTLLFNIEPEVARNFSFAIQSVGMTFAAIWIFISGIKIEKNYLLLAGAGGFIGIIFGSYFIVPLIKPDYAKMMFVSFWLSFGIALAVVNFINQRKSIEKLPHLSFIQKSELFFVGTLGGVFSSVLGNGLDICTFSYVVMKYGLSEKIATPTSVILMASNAIIGFIIHLFFLETFQTEAFHYWLVCIPVVIFGAPLGAYTITLIGRKSIAGILILIIIAQFITAIFVIKPGMDLILFSTLIFVIGIFIFFVITKKRYTGSGVN
ncbi:MAG: sulfite exporter TauE/SafE family protein [Balneolaceae bacterium]|nr:MAG: sulfite exporter TauE/SafE family protein [Balneolaceae bacterium]